MTAALKALLRRNPLPASGRPSGRQARESVACTGVAADWCPVRQPDLFDVIDEVKAALEEAGVVVSAEEFGRRLAAFEE